MPDPLTSNDPKPEEKTDETPMTETLPKPEEEQKPLNETPPVARNPLFA